MNKKKFAVLATLTFFIVGYFIAAHFYQLQKKETASKQLLESSSPIASEHSVKLGNEDAKIQLVEFLDPECESCREFYPHVKGLMKEFEGNIQLTVRYAPFHTNSIFAIKIIEAARLQGKSPNKQRSSAIICLIELLSPRTMQSSS